MPRPRLGTYNSQVDKTLSSRIRDGYQPNEGCLPLSKHWGGSPLSENPWLSRFADCVAKRALAAEAWRKLEQKMRKGDLNHLIELLYLYTVHQDTLVEVECKGNWIIKAALDSIVPAYDDLIDKLDKLIMSITAVPTPHYSIFAKEALDLNRHRAFAVELQKNADVWGSQKTDGREWYLYLMASEMERATGRQQIAALNYLLNSARAAHGDTKAPFKQKMLEKRILRFRTRYGFGHEPRGVPYSPTDAQEQIEAQTKIEDLQTLMNNKDARRLIEQIGVQGFIKLIKQYDLPELIKQFKQVGTQTDIK